MTHDEARELLCTALTEPLTPAEAQELQDHLASCAACTTERDRIDEAFDIVIGAPRPVAPPAGLRARVLASSDLLSGDRARDQLPSGAPGRGFRLLHFPRRETSFVGHPLARRLAAAAALLLIGVLAVTTVLAGKQSQQYAAAIALDNAALRLLTSTETTNTYLTRQSASLPEEAHGHWFHRPDSDTQVIVGERLSRPRGDEQYVVWLERGGQWAPVGELEVDDQGYGRLVLTGVDGANVDGVLVTIERSPTSRTGTNSVLRSP